MRKLFLANKVSPLQHCNIKSIILDLNYFSATKQGEGGPTLKKTLTYKYLEKPILSTLFFSPQSKP